MTIDDRLTTLDALWSVWAEHGRVMTDEQWQRPTRLGDWDVRSLYAHAGSWPWMLSILIDRVRDTEPTHVTAAALLQDFNAPTGVAHSRRDIVAAGAREDAARYSTAQMVEQFAGTGPRAIATARQLGPVVVDYFERALLRLDEAVSIGIVEATVHLLDLQRALGQPPDVPVEGLTHTAAVIVQMAPPVDFIESATGRSTIDLFPVLS
ncbi:maleylpyruvate isomerase N-terminal domain-containing protein [Dactylosporangium cerinum]|uniref:Maleylpyruvate isomerase N-terminal domain-containing protein n=1 Tax=Dactylosporangium cerinum TaxID=1434730 RepID=A0ABV9WAF0_9ACTN